MKMMNCQRNETHGAATFRVYSTILNMLVCTDCALVAAEVSDGGRQREGAMRIEPVEQEQGKNGKE